MKSFAVVIELRRNRVLAAWSGKSTGWLDTAMPEDMDSAQRGAWLKDLFGRELVPDGKVLLVVPRREAVLMQLELAIPEDASESDLHSVAKMNLGSHSTMDTHACVIDVVRSTDTKHAVCAAPSELVDRIRDDLKQAGRAVVCVTTRSAGLATIAEAKSTELFIGVGTREIEIVVVHLGVPVLSRCLNRNNDTEADIAKAVAEAHRAMTSATMVGGVKKILRGHLCAEVKVRSTLIDELTKQLNIEVKEYIPKSVRVPEEVLPLIQLAALRDMPVLRLRNIRPPSGLQVPAVRIGAGLGTLAAIVLIGGAFILAQQRAGVQNKLDTLSKELVQLQRNERTHLREEARLIHLQGLIQEGPVWSQQQAAIGNILPKTGIVLDRLTGTESRRTTFAAVRSENGRWYSGGIWANESAFAIDLYASVDNRAMVPRLRQSFIDDPRFDVESKGPELPDRLAFRLTSKGAVDESVSEGDAGE